MVTLTSSKGTAIGALGLCTVTWVIMAFLVLGGMLANMCVESHLRDLLEQGFEVHVVSDATAGPRHPVWGDGYKAAMVNYAFLAHGVVTTDEVVASMK